jgi:uncharacterized protein YdeI (YjbR/CyaY-like superfamily)
MNKRVDVALQKLTNWQDEMSELRAIALKSGLTEDLKWGQPCYTLEGANVFLIHAFKNYCAILFMKGSIMKDPHKLLIQQTENVQAARQMRFTSLKEIAKLRPTINSYIKNAIAIEESGVKPAVKKASEFVLPEDVIKALKKHAGLAAAFKKLTPGRQRAYVLHFTGAKQEATREARIAKAAPLILKGKGLND